MDDICIRRAVPNRPKGRAWSAKLTESQVRMVKQSKLSNKELASSVGYRRRLYFLGLSQAITGSTWETDVFGNFMDNFGLSFPLQQADAQGGLLGPNTPTPDATLGGPAAPGGAGTGLNVSPPASTAAQAPPGITGGAGNITPPSGGGGQPQPTSPASFAAPQAAAPWIPRQPLALGGGSGFKISRHPIRHRPPGWAVSSNNRVVSDGY